MEGLESIPEWFGTAVIGALIAALSFATKTLYEWWSDLRHARAVRLASLLELSSLLRASWIIFAVQNRHARRLLQLLQRNHPGQVSPEPGFEGVFAALYDQFAPEEAELHGLIRGMTVHSMRPVNEAMLNWLKNDVTFKTTYVSARTALSSASAKMRRRLAEKLHELEAHLILWVAKYETWIPDHPKHALVYLADEQAHGIAFPSDIDKVIKDVLLDLSKSAPDIPLPAKER